MNKLFLSAGHNNSDPGASNPHNPKWFEFKINKALCDRIYTTINDTITVDYISDELSLGQTVDYINKNSTKDDFAIEFHQNSAENQSAKGTEIFYFSSSVDRPKQAKAFLDKFLEKHPYFKNRGVKNTSLYFTSKTKCPALLFETGFLSNKDDSDYIVTNLDSIAKSLSYCIADLFQVTLKDNEDSLNIIKRIKKDINSLEQTLKK